MLLLLPPARTHILVLDLRTRRLKQPLARGGASRRTPVATALPAIDLVDIRAVLNSGDGTNPLPDPADLAVVLFDRGPHVGVDLDLFLHFLPQLLAARGGELVAQDVVAQLRHADELFAPGGGVLGVQVGVLVELLLRQAGELFGLGLGVAAACDAVAGVEAAAGEDDEAYKLPNIASNGFSEGSADGAAERDSGETV